MIIVFSGLSIYISVECKVLLMYSAKRLRVMVFISTFNNISVISRRSVLLKEETVVPGVHVNHRPVASH